MRFVDLEVSLQGTTQPKRYRVDMSMTTPGDGGLNSLARPGDVDLDFDALLASLSEPERYGVALASALFGAPGDDRRVFFEDARNRVGKDGSLRVRLAFKHENPELLELRWEALHDPNHLDQPLGTDEHVVLSRFLPSEGGHHRDYTPRTFAEGLRALVAIPGARGIDQYEAEDGRPLDRVDVPLELQTITDALGPRTRVTPLVPGSEPGSGVTLGRIKQALQTPHDMLVLICHGVFGNDPDMDQPEAWVFLDTADHGIQPVSATTLCRELGQSAGIPPLVFLTACQGAGEPRLPLMSRGGGVLAAVGPRLVALGIPAVVAMQGKVPRDMARRFMARFFERLAQHGVVDLAMVEARSTIKDDPAHLLPVLYMRIADGRLWSTGQSGASSGLSEVAWTSLLRAIEGGRCTPILGDELFTGVLGAPEALAQRWAEQYSYPLASTSLPEVAQFIAVDAGEDAPLGFLRDHAIENMARLLGEGDERDLATLEAKVMARAGIETKVLRELASLGLPLYLTTSPSGLFQHALAGHERSATTYVLPWRRSAGTDEDAPRLHPTADQPVVCHLFGSFDQENLMVVSEDDYFTFLYDFLDLVRDRARMPTTVSTTLVQSGLLLLGFRLEAWSFRVLLHVLRRLKEGAATPRSNVSIAVQFDPQGARVTDEAKARRYIQRYLEDYLGQNKRKLHIYWGSVDQFVNELARRRSASRAGVL